jgi:3-(3-hydroxy-phenyl)propionate hydroxylase
MFYQPELEEALRDGAARHPSVEVVGVHPGPETAELVWREVDPPTSLTGGIRARWVIGADGARSTVRAAAGTGLVNLGLEQPWLVVDVRLTKPVELPRVAVGYCDPARPATFVPCTGDNRRWELMVLPDDDPEALQRPEVVRSLLGRFVEPDAYELTRVAVYRFRALVAERWRIGRLLLAGDAAHQMPPFLGQGMCSGIRDVHNLCWKLVRVLEGRADPSLLDTYQSEREPAVRWLIESAVSVGGVLQTTDPAVAAARDEAMLAAGPTDPAPGGMPPLGPGFHVPSAAVDDLAGGVPYPQAVKGADRLLGPGFALVGPEALLQAASVEVTRATAELGAAVVHRPGPAVVVRPDRYVYGVADTTDGLRDVLDGLVAQRAPAAS